MFYIVVRIRDEVHLVKLNVDEVDVKRVDLSTAARVALIKFLRERCGTVYYYVVGEYDRIPRECIRYKPVRAVTASGEEELRKVYLCGVPISRLDQRTLVDLYVACARLGCCR